MVFRNALVPYLYTAGRICLFVSFHLFSTHVLILYTRSYSLHTFLLSLLCTRSCSPPLHTFLLSLLYTRSCSLSFAHVLALSPLHTFLFSLIAQVVSHSTMRLPQFILCTTISTSLQRTLMRPASTYSGKH
jgi:hypothetical protein